MNDTYLHTATEELVADPTVQAYLLGGRDAERWDAWLADHPAAAARMAEARALLTHLEASLAPAADEARVARVWARIAADTQDAPTADAPTADVPTDRGARVVSLDSRPRRARRRAWWALAAAAAVAAFLLLLPGRGADVYETAAGETLVVWLPDSSRVALGPASRLEVGDYGDERALRLAGEAFFEVERGAPFSVSTGRGRVRVLGTSFSVADDGELAVACATGRVRVTAGGGGGGGAGAGVDLTPGQAVRTERGRLGEVTALPVEEVAAWRRGRLYFRGAPLEEVAARLRRHFGRTFATPPALRDAPVTIDVPTDDFAAAIARLSFVLQAPLDTAAAASR